MTHIFFPFQFEIRKKTHLRRRWSTGSSRSSTRYELIRDAFVEICFVALRVRILIIEFWIRVLIFHSLRSSLEFWYRIPIFYNIWSEIKELFKNEMTKKFVTSFVSDETCLTTCFWSNHFRWLFQIKWQLTCVIILYKWMHSSCENDNIKRCIKRRFILASYELTRHQSRFKSSDTSSLTEKSIFFVEMDPHALNVSSALIDRRS